MYRSTAPWASACVLGFLIVGVHAAIHIAAAIHDRQELLTWPQRQFFIAGLIKVLIVSATIHTICIGCTGTVSSNADMKLNN